MFGAPCWSHSTLSEKDKSHYLKELHSRNIMHRNVMFWNNISRSKQAVSESSTAGRNTALRVEKDVNITVIHF